MQQNIKDFGGDPKKVTIFGQSAGGWSVDALLTSYEKNSKPPFRAASGQLSYNLEGLAVSKQPSSFALAAALNCIGSSNLTCIRKVSATTIQSVIDQNELFFLTNC